MRYWIGIDAHNKFCEVAVITDKGNLVKRLTVTTDESSLIEKLLLIKGERMVIFEESSLAQWLYVTLKPYADKIVISDPKYNKWIHADEEKDDVIDSFKLAELFRMGRIREVYHTDVREIESFRKLVLHYYKLVQNSSRAMNRIKAQYQFNGIFETGSKVYNQKKRMDYVQKVPCLIQQQILTNYYVQLDLYRQQQSQILNRIRMCSRKYTAIKRIMTFPSIGLIRAATIFAIIIAPERFSNKSQVNKYTGLAVVEKSSGGKIYSTYASRKGNRILKKVLLDAANGCITIMKDNPFRQQYLLLVQRGLSVKSARRTIARRMFRAILSAWKKGELYSEEKYPVNTITLGAKKLSLA